MAGQTLHPTQSTSGEKTTGEAPHLCQENFDKFRDTISLNEARRHRIAAARNNLDNFIQKHWFEAALAGDLRRQGSFASHTIVRPLGDEDDYDIDLLLPIVHSRIEDKLDDAGDLLDLLADSLEDHPSYEGKVKAKGRCVRIDYEDEFHVDLVPGAIDLPGCDGHPEGVVKIPDRKNGGWKRTNPISRAQWIRSMNGGPTHFRLYRLVKMLKHWRNVHLGGNPPSIVLSTLAALNNPGGPKRETFEGDLHFKGNSDALLLYDTVRMIQADLPVISGSLKNPMLGDEDLLDKVGFIGYHDFVSELSALEALIEEALHASDREEAVYHWKYIFGDRFPKAT